MSNQQQKIKCKCAVGVVKELHDKGFALIKSAVFNVSPKLRQSLSWLIAECRHLPADPFCKNGERRRRYARFVLLPWNNTLSFRPVSTYVQDGALNNAEGGKARRFELLTAAMQKNRFLAELILLDFAMLPVAKAEQMLPWDVGVHLIKMVARPGMPGLSSPDCLHKDGEPFTYVHFLERHNITGGENVVADNSKRIIWHATLTKTMDSLLIKDDAVYHQVKRIEVAAGADEGYRTVILIDFTPMKPETVGYQNLT